MTATVRLSRDEFRRLVRRALEGAGAPAGTEDEAAELALRLEERGLAGGRLALLACRRLRAGGFRPPAVTDGYVDAHGAPALVLAGTLLDLLGAGPDGEALRVRALADPAPLPVAALARSVTTGPLHLRFDSGAVSFEAVVGPDGIRARPADAAILCRPSCGRLELARAATDAFAGLAPLPLPAGGSAADGVHLRVPTLRLLSRLAAHMLVPASEESRRRGAGPADGAAD